MKIDRIDVMPIGGDAMSPAAGLLVRVGTASGLVGLGEVATDDASPATSRTTVTRWLELYAASALGAAVGNFNMLDQLLDAAEPANGSSCTAARAALEMAALDLVGRARGRPLHELLGGGYRTELELYREIEAGCSDPAGTALAAVRQGYAGIRLAIAAPEAGRAPDAAAAQPHTAAISAVLDAVGRAPFVDLVARQSLGNEQQASMLAEALLGRRFHPNLALVQPLHRLDLEGHGRLRRKLPIPIMLEESITSPEAMSQVVRHAAADRIVLDIWRVGGLRNARRIANICESAAIGVTVSGACRSAVGRAALGHLAASIHGNYPASLGSDPGAADEGLAGGLTVANGKASVDSGHGLGVALDEAWAARAMRTGNLVA